MNYEEIEYLLTEAEAENKKDNYAQAEVLCNRALENIPVLPARVSENTEVGSMSKSGEEWKKIATLRARALNALSDSFWKRGMAKEALPLAEEVQMLSFQVGNKHEEAIAFASLGSIYKNLSEHFKALDYYQKSLEIYTELENKKGIANILGNIGNVYYYLSDYSKTLDYYQKSLEIFKKIGSKKGITDILGNIGNVHYFLSDYSKALEYIQKALEINKELGNKNGIAINLGNSGVVYNDLSNHSMALDYFQQALEINKEIGSKVNIANNLANIGIAYSYLSDYPKALDHYLQALEINKEIGNKIGIALNLGNSGAVYSKINFDGYDPEKAEDYMLRAIALGEEIKNKEVIYLIHFELAELYETQERWKEFAFHLKRYHNLKEEIKSEEARKQAQILEQRRLADEREKEIEIFKAAEVAKLIATTSLLHRVLPESISTRMIQGEENISDYFPSVSILFADIQGFTAISANMKAHDVVRFLNFVFGEFDRIMKKHGCEKIKTIGDGYMAVAGAPIECEDHAERLAAAALDMQKNINLPQDIRNTMPKGTTFGIRIGLHTGPVVAGVIGEERFVYDIHSDAVNLASRMESSGEVDRVHVSADFVNHLQDRFKQTNNTHHSIRFEARGEIEIKGKGKMKTYFLENRI